MAFAPVTVALSEDELVQASESRSVRRHNGLSNLVSLFAMGRTIRAASRLREGTFFVSTADTKSTHCVTKSALHSSPWRPIWVVTIDSLNPRWAIMDKARAGLVAATAFVLSGCGAIMHGGVAEHRGAVISKRSFGRDFTCDWNVDHPHSA
jgi:hypothetical protein